MMCPSVIREDDGHVTVLGTGGSNRIRTAILQVACNLLGRGMPLHDAVVAPRMHLEGAVLNLELEGLDPAVLHRLEGEWHQMVEFPERNMFFGGVHAVRTGPSGTSGVGDERRGGVFRALA